MKKVLTYFFVTLGVIFFCLIIAGVWFWVTDPLDLKPLYRMLTAESAEIQVGESQTQPAGTDRMAPEESPEVTPGSVDRNPALNAQQEAALDTVGIDPATLPSSITAEQETCFVEVLGQARVDEIKAGATPTASEFFQARGCL